MKLSDMLDEFFSSYDGYDGDIVGSYRQAEWIKKAIQLEARLEDEEGLKMQAVQEWNRVEAENKALSVLLSDLVDVEFERDALKNELAYRKEADRKVLAEECAADEKHCTCAPALYRRIAELEAAFDDAVRALWECEIEHVRDTDKEAKDD